MGGGPAGNSEQSQSCGCGGGAGYGVCGMVTQDQSVGALKQGV